MTAPLRSARPRQRRVLADVVRRLASGDAAALDDALQLVATGLDCHEVTLRRAPGRSVLARWEATSPVESVAHQWVLDAPVRAAGTVHAVLSACAPHPFAAEQAQTLTAVADAFALWLSSQRPTDSGRTVLDEEADRAQVASTLLETVGTALVTVRYAAERVSAGQGTPSELDDPLRAAMSAVREAHRDLRAHALEAGLRAALRELAVRARADRPDDGRPPLRLSVEAEDAALDAVAPPVAVTVERAAQAALRGAAGHAALRATVEGRTVKLRVETADNAYDAGELARWVRRVSALGGVLRTGPGGVELDLPAQPSAEGHHDHSPDL